MTTFNKSKTPIGSNTEYTTDDLIAYTMEHLKNVEGDKAHVGSDKINITLGYGVVPDKVMYNGKYVAKGKHNGESLDESKLDWKTAVHDGVKASDYESIKDFATAIVADKINKHKSKLDTNKSKDYNLFKLSTIWNGGAGMLTFDGFVATMDEMDKPLSERNPSRIFEAVRYGYYTENEDKQKYYSVGLTNRRVSEINKFVKPEDKVTKVVQTENKETGLPTVELYNKRNELVYSFEATRPKSAGNKWGTYNI